VCKKALWPEPWIQYLSCMSLSPGGEMPWFRITWWHSGIMIRSRFLNISALSVTRNFLRLVYRRLRSGRAADAFYDPCFLRSGPENIYCFMVNKVIIGCWKWNNPPIAIIYLLSWPIYNNPSLLMPGSEKSKSRIYSGIRLSLSLNAISARPNRKDYCKGSSSAMSEKRTLPDYEV